MDIAQYLSQGPKAAAQTNYYDPSDRKAAPAEDYRARDAARNDDRADYKPVRENEPRTRQARAGDSRAGEREEAKSLFRDLMQKKLARKKEEAANQDKTALTFWKSKAQKPLQSDNPLLARETKLDPATLLAQNAGAQESAEDLKLDPAQELFATLELNRKAFIDLLTQARQEQNAKGNGQTDITGTIKADQKSLSYMGQSLQALLQAQGGTLDLSLFQESPLGRNLTADQLATLKEALLQAQKASSASSETTQTAKPHTADANLLQKTLEESARQALQSQRDLLRQANAVTKIASDRDHQALKTLQTRLAADTLVGAQTATAKPLPATPAQGLPEGGNDLSAADGAAKAAAKQTAQDLSAGLNATGKPAAKISQDAGAILPLAPGLQNWSDSWALPADGWVNPAGAGAAPVTGLAAQTALITQGQAATAPHPVAPVVAATLSKAAAQGQNKTLEIQLDPPELGRLQIRMQYGRDKMVKAVIMSEKPETHMMLQRDAHILERALQQAGVDMDQSSLSFALGHQQEFSHNGGHDSRGQQFGTERATSDDDAGQAQNINASVDWQVDPQTGHVRYNLLV